MKIHYRISNKKWYGDIKKILLGFERIFPNKEVGIDFTNSQSIREVNKRFRNKDSSTDIVSVEISIDDYLGDIYLSRDDVAEKMPIGLNFIEYNRFLIIHGILHLMGYDHETDEDAAIMRAEEIKLAEYLNVPNPYLIGDFND
jgi:probable rRNA maturation factor